MGAAAVVYVKDLPGMRYFYETCFGLVVGESESNDFCVLASDDWELSLVSVQAEIAASLVIANPPERRTATPIKLAFDVESIEGLRSIVIATGGQFDPNDGIWEFRGRRHLDCLDPEGNVVELRQRIS
jgi:predicted enzyme related to lactoylglutathione lyase